jgi:addiction module RelE/StbE family toxin
MTSLFWSSSFVRALKRKTRRRPDLRESIEQTLRQLADDPFHPSLRTHKLTGELSGTWACSVSYDMRILFESAELGHAPTLVLGTAEGSQRGTF